MKRLYAVLALCLTVFAAQAADNRSNDQANPAWPDNLPLPAFETPQERQVPSDLNADDVTPPPAEPVLAVAEFAPQEGVQLAYPFGYDDIFISIVRECQEVGVVYIVVENAAVASECSSLLLSNGVPLSNIEYQYHPIDAMWSRDYGAHFVWGQTSGEIALVDQQYYDGRPNDDEIPDFQAGQWHMNFYETALYHEGGNYMSDGHGNVMCSDILYSNNQTWTPRQCEEEVMAYFGATEVYVYEHITWDATGHIDLWAKMLNDTTIMVAQMQPDDPNYALVEQHAATMGEVLTVYGTPFNIVRCPMPPAYSIWIFHYYKSFLNSLIFNGKILVPIYATEPELTTQALAIHQAAMPDYEVVGIYCDNIAPAGGAIHCVTIGIAEHAQDYVHNADVNITPISPPIEIPPGGGTFQYNANVHNLESDSIYTEVWTEVRLPDGSAYGPLFEKPIPLAAGGTASRTMSQYVPGTAPAGTYTYLMYTGSRLPRVVNDSSYFSFTKTGAEGLAANNLTGWWTEEVTSPTAGLSAASPAAYGLLEAFPNPFNPTTELRFSLPVEGNFTLAVYDLQGSKVAQLASGYKAAGSYTAHFNGSELASGMYVARLEQNGFATTAKLILLK